VKDTAINKGATSDNNNVNTQHSGVLASNTNLNAYTRHLFTGLPTASLFSRTPTHLIWMMWTGPSPSARAIASVGGEAHVEVEEVALRHEVRVVLRPVRVQLPRPLPRDHDALLPHELGRPNIYE
jgi:hypothetical protein